MAQAKRFLSKNVVVTGASAGLGRAIALGFAKEGAGVALIARDQNRLKEVQQEIENLGSQALAIDLDVADSKRVEQAAKRVEAEMGPIDIWVNNAMVSVFSPIQEMTAEEFKRVTEVTYLGYVYGTLAALQCMRPRNCGVIIQIGSVLAYRGIPLQSAYCAAKHAVQGFHDSLRCELLHEKSKIRVTMIQMPALNTPQFDWVKSRLKYQAKPVSPIFQPEVGVKAVLWSALNPRRELNVGWRSTLFIFLNHLNPAAGDWYLAQNGYASQQSGTPENPSRPNNLFESVPGPFGAHGRFDLQARRCNSHFWFTIYRKYIYAALLIVGLLILFFFT